MVKCQYIINLSSIKEFEYTEILSENQAENNKNDEKIMVMLEAKKKPKRSEQNQDRHSGNEGTHRKVK